jgi:hypothetical protein
MEEHRRLGLCFNCNEKFGRGHNRVCQRLFLIDFTDVDDTDTGETADETTEEPIISVLAISGVRTKETMQLAISIGGASFRALLDSGSTHNFITEDAATRTNLTLAPHGGMRVTVANRERVACPGVYSDTPFVIEGEHFSANFYALPLAGYDIVLGTRWLASLGPILWDFSTLQMAFCHGGRPVRWQGIAGSASPFLAVCDLDHLLRALLDEFRTSSPSQQACRPRVPKTTASRWCQGQRPSLCGPTATPRRTKTSWSVSAPPCSPKASSGAARRPSPPRCSS